MLPALRGLPMIAYSTSRHGGGCQIPCASRWSSYIFFQRMNTRHMTWRVTVHLLFHPLSGFSVAQTCRNEKACRLCWLSLRLRAGRMVSGLHGSSHFSSDTYSGGDSSTIFHSRKDTNRCQNRGVGMDLCNAFKFKTRTPCPKSSWEILRVTCRALFPGRTSTS